MSLLSQFPHSPAGVVGRLALLIRFWWWKVPEPRIISVITGVIYSIYLGAGVLTLFLPPLSVESVFSSATIQIVAWFFICGALVGIVGGAQDFWQLERVGLGALFVGLSAYLYIVAELQFASASGNRFLQMGVILIAMLSLVGRGALIWRYDFKPRG